MTDLQRAIIAVVRRDWPTGVELLGLRGMLEVLTRPACSEVLGRELVSRVQQEYRTMEKQ